MKKCDMNGDGKIDYLEFVQGAIDHKALIDKDNIQAIFNMLDENKDGDISMDELKKSFNGNNSDDNAFKEIMREVDVNNDGVISLEEFQDGMKKMLLKSFSQAQT